PSQPGQDARWLVAALAAAAASASRQASNATRRATPRGANHSSARSGVVASMAEPLAISGSLQLLASDRAAERLIREHVVDEISRSLGDGRLLAPSGEDERRVRAI